MPEHLCTCSLRPADFHCFTCGLTFGSDAAFTTHLRGPLGRREHVPPSELPALGLVLGARGRWGRRYGGPEGLRVGPKPPLAA